MKCLKKFIVESVEGRESSFLMFISTTLTTQMKGFFVKLCFFYWIFLLVQSFTCISSIYVQDCSLVQRFTLAVLHISFFMLPKDTLYTVCQCRTNGSDFTGWKCKNYWDTAHVMRCY